MKDKKKHGGNMSIEIKTKEELLEALYMEAGKPVDELDADEIDRLTRLLEQYDEDKHTDTSDYEEFLQRFNDRNNTDLTSSAGKKKQQRGIKLLQITGKRQGNFVAAAAILIALVLSSQALSVASTDGTASNWVTGEDGSEIFHIENSKYESWVDQKTRDEYKVEYVNGNPNVIKMNVEQYDTTDITEVNKFNILIPTCLPDRYEFKNANIADFDSRMGHVSLYYKASKDEYLSYIAILHDSDEEISVSMSKSPITVYADTIRVNDFTAYIYEENEKVEARFCYEGVIYKVSGTISHEELLDVLEGMAYPE